MPFRPAVQNRYNVADRSSEPMLDLCDQHVEQNVAAASLELTPAEIRAITRSALPPEP